jgi:hypothetical protein
MWPAFPTSDYYGSSATSRRPQRTVRLPRAQQLGGHRRDASHVHHRPVGRVGAQLYPGGIAARYRNTARGLTRPNSNRTDKTAPNDNRNRAPQRPIAASFGAAVLYRGFNHWFVSYAFLPCYRTGPLAADRCSIVRGCSHPPPHLRRQAAPQLHPTVTAAGGRASHPARSYGASWRNTASDDQRHSPAVSAVEDPCGCLTGAGPQLAVAVCATEPSP